MTDERNISTEHQREGDAKRPSDTLDRGQGRGDRASVAENGEVRGSGSGAGGSNPGEDFDDDEAAGGGHLTPEGRDTEGSRGS